MGFELGMTSHLSLNWHFHMQIKLPNCKFKSEMGLLNTVQDREGVHEGGARAVHEVRRGFPGAALAAQVDSGGEGGGRRRDGHVQAVLLLLEGERRHGFDFNYTDMFF